MFDYIYLILIERLKELKEIKYFDLWNEQPTKPQYDSISYPALFFEFANYEPLPVSDGSQKGVCRLNLHLAIWTEAKTHDRSATQARALAQFKLISDIMQKLQRFSAVDPQGVQGGFSAMVLKQYRPDANYDQVLVHTLSFETVLHDTTCRVYKDYVSVSPVRIQIDPEMKTKITP